MDGWELVTSHLDAERFLGRLLEATAPIAVKQTFDTYAPPVGDGPRLLGFKGWWAFQRELQGETDKEEAARTFRAALAEAGAIGTEDSIDLREFTSEGKGLGNLVDREFGLTLLQFQRTLLSDNNQIEDRERLAEVDESLPMTDYLCATVGLEPRTSRAALRFFYSRVRAHVGQHLLLAQHVLHWRPAPESLVRRHVPPGAAARLSLRRA